MELTEKTVVSSVPVEEILHDDDSRFTLKLKASEDSVLKTVRAAFSF